jgi:hypothetical protein
MTVPSAAEVQGYVQEVLRRPEFNAAPAPRNNQGWILRILQWLATHRLPAIGNISIGTLILLAAAAALLVFLSLRLARFIRAGGFMRSPARDTGSPQKRAASAGGLVSPGESLRLADKALASGDARGAIQELLRGCLFYLAGLGAIVLERWKTNFAYTRECPPQVPAFGVFRDLAQAHNDIVYAHRTLDNARIRSLMIDLQRQIEA